MARPRTRRVGSIWVPVEKPAPVLPSEPRKWKFKSDNPNYFIHHILFDKKGIFETTNEADAKFLLENPWFNREYRLVKDSWSDYESRTIA